MTDRARADLPQIASWLLAALALLLVLKAGLLAALYSGLLVYALVQLLAPRLARQLGSQQARLVAVAALGSLIVLSLTAGIWAMWSFFVSDAGSVPVLLKKLADLVDESRSQIPPWLAAYLPASAEALQQMLTSGRRR